MTNGRAWPLIATSIQRIILVVALVVAPQAASGQSNFTRKNPQGSYPVGFQVVEQYDRSRGYLGTTDSTTGKAVKGERARPIQTLIWYPAQAVSGRPMTAGDYLRLRGTAEAFERSSAERARAEANFVNESVVELSPERARAELAAPMMARREAVPHSGKFPVVIYAPSFGAPAFENADLCEYLASFGYLVIASPSNGHRPGGMTPDLEGAEAQMADIEFLIGYAHGLPNADTRHLAAIGFSWGGLANVMAAAKDPRIDALVSLDGSVRSWPNIIAQSGYVTPERVTAPFLYLAAAPKEVEDSAPDVNQNTSFLNKVKYGDLFRVTLKPYVHRNFAVMLGQRFLPERYYGDYDRDELSVANGWVETYVRQFLDAYLKDDPAARAFLALPAKKTGAPAHMLSAFSRQGKGAPLTRATFAAELARRGFGQASTIYKEFEKRDPLFKLSDNELTSWGYALLRSGETNSAIAIFRLDTELHAESANAWDSFAEALAANGDRAAAIEAYRRSLLLNPENANAVLRLKKLDANP